MNAIGVFVVHCFVSVYVGENLSIGFVFKKYGSNAGG